MPFILDKSEGKNRLQCLKIRLKKLIATSLQKNAITICSAINIFLICISYFNRGIK
jgi:hypothetical protein